MKLPENSNSIEIIKQSQKDDQIIRECCQIMKSPPPLLARKIQNLLHELEETRTILEEQRLHS